MCRTLFKTFSLFTAILIANCCTAQKKESYYDEHWKPCEKETATYYSVQQKTDSGYYQQDYFMNGGRPQMFALYEDNAYKIQHGNATYYYANGIPQIIGRFVHGQREGVAMSYHPNGVLSDSGFYHAGQPVGNVYKWYANGFMSDSIARIKDSSYVHVSWFDDGSIASAGRETNGKEYGPWIYYRKDGSKAASEMYENGKCISTKHFDETGNETMVNKDHIEYPSEFKGGVNKWKGYLEKNLIWPNGYHFTNTTSVLLMVQMTIDEQGNITDVYVVNPFHPVFDKVAYDVISKGPKWMPAIQHNRPVKYRFVQSVTFAEQ